MYNGSGMAVPSAGGGGEGAKVWHFTVGEVGGISIFFFIMSIVWLVLLPIGLGIDKINLQYNPSTDFDAIDFDVSIGNGCTIIAAEHMAEQR